MSFKQQRKWIALTEVTPVQRKIETRTVSPENPSRKNNREAD